MATPATTLARFLGANPGMGPVEGAVELLGGSLSQAAVVSPSDTVDLTTPTKRLYVGVAGDVKVDMVTTGTAIVFKALPIGFHNIQAKSIYSTGTAATNMVALY